MDDLTKMIAAGVLTPVLGLVGTKVKELLEARDVRQQSRRMMDEVTNLLAFTDTLEKAAKSGGALTNIPSESLAQLQTAIAERIQAAVVHLSPPSAVKIQERHMARDIFDRVFLLHKPLVWWGWPLHILYYGLAGIAFVGSFGIIGIIGDFQEQAKDRWDGVVGMIALAVFAVILNVFANLVDRRKSKSMTPPAQPDDALATAVKAASN